MKRYFFHGSTVLAGLMLLMSCRSTQQSDSQHSDGMIHYPGIMSAVCVLNPTQGNNVRGMVRFTRDGNNIRITADIDGLAPGKHGFHIHEAGDCSAPDASSAGGHYNPHGEMHGAPDANRRHVGDFGNLEADASGHAHYERIDETIRFEGVNNIIGRAIIVHAGSDDLASQPTGNAGGRVACGVIGVAK